MSVVVLVRCLLEMLCKRCEADQNVDRVFIYNLFYWCIIKNNKIIYCIKWAKL